MLLAAQEVALQLDVDAPRKERGEAVQLPAGGLEAARDERARHGALLAARQDVQPLRVRGDVFPRSRGLPLRLAHGGRGEKGAEVPVAPLVFGEESQTGERDAWRKRGRDETQWAGEKQIGTPIGDFFER